MIWRYTSSYFLLFILMAGVYRYDLWLQLPPASIHQWRQADGAAIAWHYALNSAWTEVQICNLFYTNDNHAVGELPVLYGLAGQLTRSGIGLEYPLRWIGLILLSLGGWGFGWVVLQLSRHWLVALFSAGLLLTVPILCYYGPSFLPDAPAFCLILLLLASLFRCAQTEQKKWLWLSGALAALAIMLKLSMAVLPLSLVLMWVWQKWRGEWRSTSIWSGRTPLWVFLALTLAVGGFRWWVSEYNGAHQAMYFLTSTRPIWNYNWAFIKETVVMAGRMGLPVFGSAGWSVLVIIGLVFTLRNWRQTPAPVQAVLLFAGLGSLAYFLLWFRMFREHDYYLICLLVLPVLLFLNGLQQALLRYRIQQLIYLLCFCWLLGLVHATAFLNGRLETAFYPTTTQNLPPDAFLPPEFLETQGIPPDSRLLCPEDPSPNIALFALRRHGWTAYNFGDRITADTLVKYQEHFNLRYLALRNPANYTTLYQQFFPVPVAQTRGWLIYSQERAQITVPHLNQQ